MTTPKRLLLEPATEQELAGELAKNLASGGCFVPRASGFAANESCELVIVHPRSGARLGLSARVVWVASGARSGVGVAFEGFSPAMREQLRAFVAPQAQDGGEWEPSVEPDGEQDGDHDGEQDAERDGEQAGGREGQPSLHVRLRGLSLNEQLRMAREGEPHERIVLERLYGKAVWIALLANPRLTVPEVQRLARMGNMPLLQLEVIAGNATWLANSQVRRALLGNPRLSLELARRVLAATPKAELRLVLTQTAYTPAMRAEAKRLLARG